MRHSILSRSAVAVASLAVGSAALAAVPANAASVPSVSRDQVLTAINGVRAAQATESGTFSKATQRAVYAILSSSCDIDIESGEYTVLQSADPTTAGDDADGILLSAYVNNNDSDSSGNSRYVQCTTAAFAATGGGYQLSGTATIDGLRNPAATPATQQFSLSGTSFVTPGILDAYNQSNDDYLYDATSTANGSVSKTVTVKDVKRVADKKTTAEKRAAKNKYGKRIAAAKRAYAKALDKADTRAERAAAKKQYKADRASALAKYKYARADYKIVTKKSKVTKTFPFSVTTKQAEQPNQEPIVLQ